jgi:hypothetical protein
VLCRVSHLAIATQSECYRLREKKCVALSKILVWAMNGKDDMEKKWGILSMNWALDNIKDMLLILLNVEKFVENFCLRWILRYLYLGCQILYFKHQMYKSSKNNKVTEYLIAYLHWAEMFAKLDLFLPSYHSPLSFQLSPFWACSTSADRRGFCQHTR